MDERIKQAPFVTTVVRIATINSHGQYNNDPVIPSRAFALGARASVCPKSRDVLSKEHHCGGVVEDP